MIPRRLSWSALAILLAGVWPALAELPQAEARLDTTQVTLGEPLHLYLRLRYRRGDRPILPSLTQALPGVSVRPGTPQESSSDGEGVAMVAPYEIRLYRLGTHRIPPLQIGFVQASGDTLVRTTEAVEVLAVPVRPDGEENLRDIKPPFAMPTGFARWLTVLLAVLVVAGAAGAAYWWRARRRPVPAQVPRPPVDYLAEFGRIAALGLLERGAVKIYYALLAEALRRFLEEHAGVAAMERTTAEIGPALRQAGLGQELVRDIDRYLQAADLVKFARAQPPLEAARQAPEAGKELVRAVQAFLAAREARLQAQLQAQTAERVGG